MNKYMAIGNLTQDPQCKEAGNSKVCNFSIAINEYYYVDGAKKQNTFYIDVECWSKQAENCVKFLSKGKKVAIEGKLKSNSWEKNGQKFSKVFCSAERVHFLASEESGHSSTPKNNKEKIENNIENNIENDEVEIDDIDDIPF